MGANIDMCMMSNNTLDPGRIFLRNPAKFAIATTPNDPLLRPSQGFWGTGKQGYLFQGNYEITVKNENKQLWRTGNIGIDNVLAIDLREHDAIKESRFWFGGKGEHNTIQLMPVFIFYQNGPPPLLPLPPTAPTNPLFTICDLSMCHLLRKV